RRPRPPIPILFPYTTLFRSSFTLKSIGPRLKLSELRRSPHLHGRSARSACFRLQPPGCHSSRGERVLPASAPIALRIDGSLLGELTPAPLPSPDHARQQEAASNQETRCAAPHPRRHRSRAPPLPWL